MSFGIGEKNTTNLTEYKTESSYSDTSANAGGDNSIAVGANGSVQITNTTLNEGVALAAIDQSASVASKAIDSGLAQTAFTVNTIRGLSESAARENADTRNFADLALKTASGLTQKLQEQTSSALERAQAPEATSVSKILTPILYVGGAIVALVALAMIFKKKDSK